MDEDHGSHPPALRRGAQGQGLVEPVARPPGQAVMDGDQADAAGREP
jgi:hypothetical protein